VKFRDRVCKQEIDVINNGLGITVIKFFHHIGVYHLRLPADLEVEEAIEIYTRDPKVEYAEPNYTLRVNPPSMTDQE
jgi:hypothetical protein